MKHHKKEEANPKQSEERSEKYEPKLKSQGTFENAIKSLVRVPKKEIKK